MTTGALPVVAQNEVASMVVVDSRTRQQRGRPPGTGGPPRRRRRRPSRRRILVRRVVVGALVVALLWLGGSVGSAVMAPTGDSVSAKLAEWARDHGLGAVVTAAETVQYDLNPPAEGGSVSIPSAPKAAAVPAPVQSSGTGGSPSPAMAPIVPARMTSPAGAPLPGEGAWSPIETVGGVPALYATYVRPDANHTSYLAGVVSMDPRLVRFSLHPGTADPGPGDWKSPADVPQADRASLLATFNGGFKIKDSQGGFFLNGSTAGTLQDGAASIVFHQDGHVTVGTWGVDQHMAPDVVGVRQNLKLIVDKGAIPASVDSATQTNWGATIGGGAFVWRSGFGVTRDGRLIFVYGPAMSVRDVADLLQRAGVVTGLQMEINPAWMSFMYYQPTSTPGAPTPVKLLASQERPADRYFTPTSRDFIEVTAR